MCWCVEESCHFEFMLLQCIPDVFSAPKHHKARSPPGYVLTQLLDASAIQSCVDSDLGVTSWHFKNMTIEMHIMHKHIPYKRHPQVIHGMKSCKLSLFIPPLAGQWLEPPHLIGVHCGLGGWPSAVHGRTDRITSTHQGTNSQWCTQPWK